MRLTALKRQSLDITPVSPGLLSDPRDLECAIKGYFDRCIENNDPPTMTGLALTVGATRRELLNFKDKSNLLVYQIVQRAKQVVSEHVEKLLLSGLPAGGFSLWLRNNDDWVDKTEHTQTNLTQADVIETLDALEYKEDPDNPNTYIESPSSSPQSS
jgi:hypothetical protein